MLLITPPGVYRAQGETELLIKAFDVDGLSRNARVLDVSTGSGAGAASAAQHGASVTAVDVSWTALATARVNAALHGPGSRSAATATSSSLCTAMLGTPGRTAGSSWTASVPARRGY
ncbi:methyltransferase [Streptacidiphilus jiangxiensis]|uniref:methyltransferase n=1 Tax=Streptacidiphilus jiangxiensis TaxID=235985 RepID=UPI00094597C7|nr:methyltransferase [Streptacidiphilus jiangxiensis]